jgi:hypothetical protein
MVLWVNTIVSYCEGQKVLEAFLTIKPPLSASQMLVTPMGMSLRGEKQTKSSSGK